MVKEEVKGGYKSYVDAFGAPGTPEGTYMKDSRLAKAYETVLDVRKFEIDLYWKRSSSFWLLVGGITAGLGLLFGMKSGGGARLLSPRLVEMACCFLSAAGCFVCIAWTFLNKGSKFWQRNWEYQVQVLEDLVVGPLYKTVLAQQDTKKMYSVTRLNECIAICFATLFAMATIFFLIGRDGIFALDQLAQRMGMDLRPLAFFIKLIVLLIAALFSLRAFRKVVNVRQIWPDGKQPMWDTELDKDIEASVRTTKLVGISRSAAAYKHWEAPRAPVADATASIEVLGRLTCDCLYCALSRRLRHKKV